MAILDPTKPYFIENENWGDLKAIDQKLIDYLYKYREITNVPFIIHNAYATYGHSEKSQHYRGKAVDGHSVGLDILDAYIIAERVGFNGIGLYDWGIHLDVREETARWCRINGVYLPITAKNIDILRGVNK
jgi:uncharacterized protein YcbK (DUF882 family)